MNLNKLFLSLYLSIFVSMSYAQNEMLTNILYNAIYYVFTSKTQYFDTVKIPEKTLQAVAYRLAEINTPQIEQFLSYGGSQSKLFELLKKSSEEQYEKLYKCMLKQHFRFLTQPQNHCSGQVNPDTKI